MIKRITIRKFKRFEEEKVDLDQSVVFVGRNNSGKTTALQALSLWEFALRNWLKEREKNRSKAKQRVGVPISRERLATAIPSRVLKHLWHDANVYSAPNKPALIEILVEGINSKLEQWKCGMELQSSTAEQFLVRPMRIAPDSIDRMPVPNEARNLHVAHLPAMAGIQRTEEVLQRGSQDRRIAEGRAGDVIRNLLLDVHKSNQGEWELIRDEIARMFYVELCPPYVEATGYIVVEFHNGISPKGKKKNPHPKLDISNGGSGFLQTLLLLTFLQARSGAVILLDEPDAHLEIVRQGDVYSYARKLALEKGSQFIVATHSEAILSTADLADIVAFPGAFALGSTSDRAQIRKSLTEVPSSDFMLAGQHKHILYVEDYTDIEILRAWAEIAGNGKALDVLHQGFSHYIGNKLSKAREHFHVIKQFVPELTGIALIDQTDISVQTNNGLVEYMWSRKEIENYLLVPDAIIRLCVKLGVDNAPDDGRPKDLFLKKQQSSVEKKARELLENYLVKPVWEDPLAAHPPADGTNASTQILEPFFKDFFKKIGKYNEMPKKNMYRLAEAMKPEEMHPDVLEVLDLIGK